MKRLTNEKFIERSVEKWGNKYDYSITSYTSSTTKIIFDCPQHGKVEQLPSNHLKYGCGICGRNMNTRNVELKKSCTIEFSSKANKIHNNKYDYSEAVYKTAQTKLTIICKDHGSFLVSPNNHLRGKGCPTCGLNRSKTAKIKKFDDYYAKFKQLYSEKYDYSQVKWVNACTVITVVCNIHGEFQILPYLHKTGRGCSKCSNQYSKISIDWLSLMALKYSTIIQHAKYIGEFTIPGRKYKADGYSESLNIIFEFHGDFWHGNPKIYNQEHINPRTGDKYKDLYNDTLEKSAFLKNKGFNLIEIWEADWKNFVKSIKTLQKIWRKIYNNENA